MKINSDLKLRQVGPKFMIVRVNAAQVNLNEVYTLNATAAALWKWAQGRDFTASELAGYLCEHYEVERTVAQADVDGMLADWRAFGLLSD